MKRLDLLHAAWIMHPMQIKINSAREVIDALGGYVAVAKLMGVGPKAVSNWYVRGLPPTSHWLLSQILQEKGIDAPPALWRQYEGPPALDAGIPTDCPPDET